MAITDLDPMYGGIDGRNYDRMQSYLQQAQQRAWNADMMQAYGAQYYPAYRGITVSGLGSLVTTTSNTSSYLSTTPQETQCGSPAEFQWLRNRVKEILWYG